MIDIDTAQHVIVTLAALVAAWFIIRRVFSAVRPAKPGQSPCASCPAHTSQAATSTTPARDASASRAHPLIVVKR